MTIRRWKLTGQQLDPVVIATITIDGTQVFSGNFVETADESINDVVLASGTFELDDSTDTVHNVAVSIASGSVLVGLMYWDNQYKINPALTADEAAYLFTGAADTFPAAINSSVASKGGWGSYNPDNFGFFPGHALVAAGGAKTQDVRKNIQIDGSEISVDINGPILVSGSSTLTYTSGIPAKPI